LGVLTEIELRDRVKREGHIDAITVDPNTLITPAAAQYAREQGIKIIYGDRNKGLSKEQLKGQKKPEHYTHLDHKNLVPKTHPRIKLRGMLDLLQALIIKAQVTVKMEGMMKLVGDLEQLLAYTRQLLRNELTGEEIPELKLFGLSEEEIHEYSHHPFKKIGVNHIIPSHHMGQIIAELNYLRTVVRQVELAACDVYLNNDGTVEREDIIRALNRLSSAVYVMECMVVAGHYHSRTEKQD